MSYPVSETFRQNCYDDTKKQRLVMISTDYDTLLTNEDIVVSSKVKFNLTSCKSQQIMFGEVNKNTCSLSLMNEDGHITSEQVLKEFRCYIGVEVSSDDYQSIKGAITAARTKDINVSIHSTAPYIRGNCTIGDYIPELENGWKTKMILMYNRLYIVVEHEGTRYYDKHTRSSTFVFGDSEEPSDYEKYLLDRLMDDSNKSALSFYTTGFAEYLYDKNVSGSSTWTTLKSGTWDDAKDKTWGHYSGYTNFKSVRYEAVPFGIWHFDRPRKVNTAMLTLNGKDRMDRFDEDSKDFITYATGYRYTVLNYITKMATYKGISRGDNSGFNALCREIYIRPNYMEGKSIKDLLSYACEVGAANAMIDRDGRITCNNSNDDPIEIPYAYSFDVADYVAHTIGTALVYKQGDYTVYQTDSDITDGATYDWNDNPFFAKSNPSSSWFSNGAHTKYGGFYNAICVSDSDYSIWCDDVYSFEQEGVTYVEPIFSMSVEWDGFGRTTYTNYGESSREYSNYDSRVQAVSSVNDVNLQGFNEAKYADKLEFSSDGLTVYSQGLKILNHNGEKVLDADSNGNLIISGKLQAATGSFEGDVKADSGYIGNWNIVDDNLKCQNNLDNNNYIILGKDHGYPTLSLSESIGVSSAGNDVYQADVGASTISFKDKIGSAALTVGASISYGVSSRGRSLNISGNDRSDSYGICEVRIQSTDGENAGQVSLIAPVVYFSSSPYISNPPTTSTAANTTLISSTYGYRVHRVSSLRKYKDNIKTIENPTEKVDTLRGVSFTSKCEADDPKTVMFGFIAEEVAEAVPELATYVDGKLQSVQYERVCALLVEDNKALHKRISDLEARLDELERRLNK